MLAASCARARSQDKQVLHMPRKQNAARAAAMALTERRAACASFVLALLSARALGEVACAACSFVRLVRFVSTALYLSG